MPRRPWLPALAMAACCSASSRRRARRSSFPTPRSRATTFALPPPASNSMPTGLEFAVARNVLAQDFVVQSHARQLSGDAGYQVQLRGCVDDSDQFYRVTVEPTSGAVSMQRAQCNTGTTL